MSHELSKLNIVPGAKRSAKRLGRGIGSGSGKTAGRGTKGQLSRSGGSVRPGFEGGQMPLQRRLPKRGFVNIFAESTEIVNLDSIERLGGSGVVDIESMVQAGMVSGKYRVKVLANGELTKAVSVKANAFSKQAISKIEACGGSVEVV